MKKLVFAAVAAIALTASVTFVACDPKQPTNTDTTTVDTTATVEVAEDTTTCDSTTSDTTTTDSIAE